MFGHHGSLTTLLNLIDLLNFRKKIMLVGFDMNGRDYFFEKIKILRNIPTNHLLVGVVYILMQKK